LTAGQDLGRPTTNEWTAW